MSKRTDLIYADGESTKIHTLESKRRLSIENPSFKNALAVWHMFSLDDTAGNNSFLTICGDVEIGIEIESPELEESIKRGGDGCSAKFNGGYLDAGQGSRGELNLKGKEMSLCARLIDPKGDWDAPIISKYGSGSRMIYRLFAAQANNQMLLAFELGLDSDDRPLQVSVPIELIGEEKWHDIIIRYNKTKLEMFVDGVLVDEEWTMGEIRQANSEPCLIGAEINEGNIKSGFYGFIDHIALWDRAISNEEIIILSGGKDLVTQREHEILGDEKAIEQYWKPRGHNVYVGDCMPFFYDGTFHLFYLHDRRHHRSKWGYGAHQWAHISTTDLINWKHHPLAIPITEEHEGSICTGSVLFYQGTYYAYYATRIPKQGEFLSYATSINGIHFIKNQPNPLATPEPPYKKGPFRDPAIFQDEEGLFHLLVTSELEIPYLTARGGCLAHLTSVDLQTWETKEPFIVSGQIGQPECPDYFYWNGWYYLVYSLHGIARYRISKEQFGPWQKLKNDSFDGAQLRVLKTAEFTGNRRIGVAFLPDGGYGGHLVFREIIQYEDGSLGTKFVEETIPKFGESIQLQFGALTDSISNDDNNIKINATDSIESVVLSETPRDFRVTLQINPEPNASCFGICVRGSGNFCEGNEIRIEPHKQKVGVCKPDSSLLEENESSSIYFVEGLDKPFKLDAIVKNDLIDICIDNRRTLISRIPKFNGNRLFLFAQNASVSFEDIEVRPFI
jgi:sucrose-6-phosphate hydrolase SacC (GH32 family)